VFVYPLFHNFAGKQQLEGTHVDTTCYQYCVSTIRNLNHKKIKSVKLKKTTQEMEKFKRNEM